MLIGLFLITDIDKNRYFHDLSQSCRLNDDQTTIWHLSSHALFQTKEWLWFPISLINSSRKATGIWKGCPSPIGWTIWQDIGVVFEPFCAIKFLTSMDKQHSLELVTLNERANREKIFIPRRISSFQVGNNQKQFTLSWHSAVLNACWLGEMGDPNFSR